MFNRALLVQTVKTPRKNTTSEPAERQQFDIDKINTLVMKSSKKLAVGFVAVYAAVTVLSTASEIAINAAPKKH